MEETATREADEAVPVDSGLVALRDGRSIAWTAWGALDGATVIDQPHLGDSGRTALTMDIAPLTEAGIRVVVVCRAGLGPSTRHPGRTEQTDAEDMLQIIDALGLDRARLLGECGGTGATLALAARWPDRVSGVALVSSMAPLAGPDADSYVEGRLLSVRRSLRFGLIARWMARSQVKAFGRDPAGFLDRARRTLPAVDRSFVEDPVRRAHASASSSDFYALPERVFDEWRSMLGPWAFDVSAVRSPVLIEHGDLDTTAPAAMAKWLSGRLPSGELRIDPDRGHFVAPDRLVGILKALIALGEAP